MKKKLLTIFQFIFVTGDESKEFHSIKLLDESHINKDERVKNLVKIFEMLRCQK